MAQCVFAVALIAVLAGVASAQSLNPQHPYHTPDDRVLVIAHRGGGYLRPENTLLAFQHAARLGVDVLEMDVRSTADNVLVVIHDETVDRTTNGTGDVRDYTFAELQRLDAAYHWVPVADDGGAAMDYPYRDQDVTIPTLEDVLTAFPQMVLSIEIKQVAPSIARPLCDLLRRRAMLDRVVVGASHGRTLADFRRVCPDAYTAGTASELRALLLAALNDLLTPDRLPVSVFHVAQTYYGVPLVTSRVVSLAHSAGVRLYVWTVNTPDEMQRLVDLGVDGIITDRPDALLRLLGRLPAAD